MSMAKSDTLLLLRVWSRGNTVESGADAPPTVGNCLPLKNIPLATVIHNIEMRPGQGAVLCRSAGTNAVLDGSRSQVGSDFIAQW